MPIFIGRALSELSKLKIGRTIMKINETIKKFEVGAGVHTLELDAIYPVAEIKGPKHKIIKTLIDDREATINQDGVIYLNKVIVEVVIAGVLEFILGPGYVAMPDQNWTEKFH